MDLNKEISKWPAIILADKRTANVTGRINILINSITTIKGIKIFGVPKGTRWEIIELKLFSTPQIIKPTQVLRDKEKVTLKWAVLEKTKGNNPDILLNKIIVKTLNKTKTLDNFLFLKTDSNSFTISLLST